MQLYLILICWLAAPLGALGQTGFIKGFVYELATGEPSIFTPVHLVGTSLGATTDVNGYFAIRGVHEGNYELRIIYLGFDTLCKPMEVNAGQIVNEKLYLTRDPKKSTSYLVRNTTTTPFLLVRWEPNVIELERPLSSAHQRAVLRAVRPTY